MPLPDITLQPAASSPGSDNELSRNHAASLLGVSLTTIDKLIQSEYVPDLDSTRILALAGTPYVDVRHGLLPVLRTRPAGPAPDGDERSVIGDSAQLSHDDYLTANAAWWRCDSTAIVDAGILAVTLGSFITGVLQIHGVADTRRWETQRANAHRSYTEERHAFTATLAGRIGVLGDPETYAVMPDIPVTSLARDLLGARVDAQSGGPIAYLSGNEPVPQG